MVEIFKVMPKLSAKLKIFGEVDVVWDYLDQKIKKKLDNEEKIHPQNIKTTRDIFWIKEMPYEIVDVCKMAKIEETNKLLEYEKSEGYETTKTRPEKEKQEE